MTAVPAEFLCRVASHENRHATLVPPKSIVDKDSFNPEAPHTPAYYTGWILKVADEVYRVGEYNPKTDMYQMAWPD